ncbi:16S rRNA (cytidine(1402)-2'-O)-methyltransferase [Heliobacterium chlorum]|uniref:Ribosomal RNA small subunit methyltransferase I n=1 Tax=Heliobacterium chlorum TaxID=2698 RepID=A0ABR7T3M9_HELCL|nr:16S rRNA (cytidine(1402)-2'-O)-methyltransferase [Heliobacterium chlorum]MBC9784161.1 16S rRNA (cytidine(1402)-2'-O)-methyltransferase [Heliobacterium chlorum]
MNQAEESPSGAGKLIVCATPIGNLEDITLRVLQALKRADLIAAEDTRHTRKLLSAYDIHVPLTSYHEHNRFGKGTEILDKVAAGAVVALVSDAGLPGISDPGEDLVRQCVERGLPVEVLPGPTASLTALVLSGLPTGRFVFEGFLPRQKKEYRERIASLAREERTLIIYESPYRVRDTVKDLRDAFGGERKAALIRELTKKYEEVRRGTLDELALSLQEGVRGECTLVVAGFDGQGQTKGTGEGEQSEGEEESDTEKARRLTERIRILETEGDDHKSALKKAAQELGLPRREAYRLKLLHEGKSDSDEIEK